MAQPADPDQDLDWSMRPPGGLFDGVRFHYRPVLQGQFAQLAEVSVKNLHLLLAQILDVDEPVTRALDGGHEFV